MQAHLLTPPPRPSEKVPGLPPGLDVVVRTASGSGRVRWTHYTEVGTGLLTVVFDDPDRQWIVIDASWDGHTGQDLYDLWWSPAPL
ncbi:hypothetical protein [Nocardia higoensis]|uniref:hypothetical protein n=1 Tax=Nocardia higoensis TaxID=228599 RepID=UPI0002EB9248|nr:hypothetical protein [Nocardia higoensis]